MAVTRVEVKIGSISAPHAGALDRAELKARIGDELAALLAREPARTPSRGTTVKLPPTAVAAASLASTAEIAHAIARRVHARLRAPEEGS